MKVLFDDINPEDYGFLLENYSVGNPEPQLSSVSVPGMNGELDMSRALTGKIMYYNRTVNVLLAVYGVGRKRDIACENLINKLVGRRFERIMFSNLPGFFRGSCKLDSKETQGLRTALVLSLNCHPFRITDEISTDIELSEEETTIYLSAIQPTVPEITSTEGVTVTYGESTYTYAAGTHSANFLIDQDDEEVKVSGNGTLTFSYNVEVI